MEQNQNKINIILFNLGGPSNLKSVKSFLFNLFNDPLIIRVPKILRLLLAWVISTLRTKKTQAIYAQMNGKSPILENTLQQADALQKYLKNSGIQNVEIHTVMRYTSPRAKEIVEKFQWESKQETILVPLYPQYSTTTTLSSIHEFTVNMKKKYPLFTYHQIGCYPVLPGLIKYYVNEITQIIKDQNLSNPHILFSAHGLPLDVTEDGDPYQYHVQQMIKAIFNQLNLVHHSLTYHECYQSKVGPKKWLTPSTEHLIKELSKQDENIIVVPIAFVSEHSETLVELDIEYKQIAKDFGAKSYHRIPAPSTNTDFIQSLAQLILSTLNEQKQPSYCTKAHDCLCYPHLKTKGNLYVKNAHNTLLSSCKTTNKKL